MLALIAFIENLPIDSALYKAMNPKDEFAVWTTTMKTNAILADTYDLIAARFTRGKAKPYSRPTDRKGIGKGAIPIKDFWDWWNKGE